jgi:glucose 1-dehydrogenase
VSYQADTWAPLEEVMIDLTGKVALITGSSRGIVRGCALEMAKVGANVVVNYRTHKEEAEEVAEAIRDLGQEALVVHADVADCPAVDRMVEATIERFGYVDIVVANAAFSIRKPFLEMPVEDMRRVLDVSLWGVFHVCQSAARDMVKRGKGGKIIIISSVHAFIDMIRKTGLGSCRCPCMDIDVGNDAFHT